MNFPPSISTTQKDIAKAVGLAQSTVASALNPKFQHKLLPETVALIQAKARELNYRPQRQARILRTGRSHIIGVVFRSAPYHAPQERVRYLAHSAIKAGYQLVAIDTDWFGQDTAAAQNYLFDVAAEGIIFCNVSAEGQLGWREFTQERLLPTVSMAGGPDVMDQALPDIRSAYRDMTLHHMAQGSRKLNLLLPFHDPLPPGKVASSGQKARVAGFMDAIQSAGGKVTAEAETSKFFDISVAVSISENSELEGRVLYPLRTELHKNVFDLGYHETKRLLSLDRGLPNSLLCSNDDIAMGALAACHESGVSVPDSIRISGADNAPFAAYCTVPLSTIEQPAQRMAEWSVRRMIELIEKPGERNSTQKETFPCQLIFRRSSVSAPLDPPSHPNPQKP